MVGSWNENILTAITKAPTSSSHTSPEFPKEILRVFATQVKNAIRNEIGDSKFCVIIDEARVRYEDPRISIVLRFVDRHGLIQEHFFGTVDFPDYEGPSSLKSAIYSVLSAHNLDGKNIRGQNCLGTVFMRDHFNEMQASIMSDFPHAYYIHCFNHSLQQALLAASEQHIHDHQARPFFSHLTEVGLRLRRNAKDNEKLKKAGELLENAKDCRWSSLLESLTTLLDMYDEICTHFEKIIREDSPSLERSSVAIIYENTGFEFVFVLFLMKEIVDITDPLCQALRCREKDIIDLMELISKRKSYLLQLHDEKWGDFLASVTQLCEKSNLVIPDMGALYVAKKYLSIPQPDDFFVEDHYCFHIFNSVIDSQLQEINHRFSANAIELLILTSALNPQDASEIYNIDDICRLVIKLYPHNFTDYEKIHLKMEFQDFLLNVVQNSDYKKLSTISELYHWLVKTKR